METIEIIGGIVRIVKNRGSLAHLGKNAPENFFFYPNSMKKLIAIAALAALFPFSASAWNEKYTDFRSPVECADETIALISEKAEIYSLVQRVICREKTAKSLVEIFREKLEMVFVK
jgi:hypothetical protein